MSGIICSIHLICADYNHRADFIALCPPPEFRSQFSHFPVDCALSTRNASIQAKVTL